MASWAEFESAAPALAAAGRRLLYRNGDGEGLLATVRDNAPPRLNPVNAGVVDGRLYLFVVANSAKRVDLDTDGRYALHAHIDPHSPSEFSVRGRVRPVTDAHVFATVGHDWFFNVSDRHVLYELDIERVLLGERATADDWPPLYSSWAAPTA